MKLHPWQEASVKRALNSAGIRWLFNDEMGLGKTAQGISAARELSPESVLCAVPALVRRQWEMELGRFWPNHPDIGVIFAGRTNKSLSKKKAAELARAWEAPIVVCSHNLLPQIAKLKRKWGVILIDEAHLFQRPTSTWSKAAREIVRENPRAGVFPMTATVMPNVPADLWNLSDIVCPGRFGLPSKTGKINHQFGVRYTNAVYNGYGWKYPGVNELFQEELKMRLAAWSSRTTQDEVRHLLPPLNVRVVQGELGWDPIVMAHTWAEDALTEVPHVCVLTHLKKTAREIAAQFVGDDRVTLITGDESVEQRKALLEATRTREQSILVATMHSVGRGIALTWYKRALLAELYWRPETLEQVLGRFCRLGATGEIAIVDVLVIPGMESERIAMRVLDKVEAFNAIAKEGNSARLLREAVAGMGADDFLEGIRSAASSRIEGDYACLDGEDDEDSPDSAL